MCTNLMHTLTIVSRWNVKWSVKYKVYLCPVAFKYTFNVQWHELINALSVECDYGFLMFIDSPSIVETITMTMLFALLLLYSILKFFTVQIKTASAWMLKYQPVIIITYIRIWNYSLVCTSFFCSVFSVHSPFTLQFVCIIISVFIKCACKWFSPILISSLESKWKRWFLLT